MQKILTFIITIAILYTLIEHNFHRIAIPNRSNENPKASESSENNSEEIPVTGNFFEKTLSTVMINVLKTDEGRFFMESLLQPMNTSVAGSGAGFKMNNDNFIKSMFKISSFGEGDVGPASCGHVVTIHYKILNSQNIVLKDDVATYPLGSEKVAPGLDAVIVGMRAGEARHATISNKYFQNKKRGEKVKEYKVNVLLKEIMPRNFIDDSVKIYDDQIAYRIPLMCGNKAIFDAKITRLKDNKVIYNSEELGKQIDMKIGSLKHPVIFSHALHNKIPIGNRTVLAKGKFLKSFVNNNSVIFPETTLPEQDLFMIEFYNFHEKILTKPSTFPNRQGAQSQASQK